MKRLMPTELITFLQTHPNCHKADCFMISLPTGETLYATEGQWDITFLTSTHGWGRAQTTFNAVQYGVWMRGPITSEATVSMSAGTMALTCITQPDMKYPGLDLGLLNAALNHLFDGATVWVFTAYMPMGGYGDVSAGIETKWQGTITKTPSIGRNVVEFECADPIYLLNMKVPSRLMQSNCPWSFCDANCTLNAADFTVSFTAASGSTSRVLIPTTAFTSPAGYFAQGVVKCLTGANAGLSQTVKLHSSGNLTITVPWLLPVQAGDTFSVIKGCDKTIATCAATTRYNGTPEPNDFRVRFGGTPFVPAPSMAL